MTSKQKVPPCAENGQDSDCTATALLPHSIDCPTCHGSGAVIVAATTPPDTAGSLDAAHPAWCLEHHERPEKAFESAEHEGRVFTLDTSNYFADTVTVALTQIYEMTTDGLSVSPAQVRLSIVNNDAIDSGASAYLSPGDVARLVAMLSRATVDLGHA